PVKLGGGGRRRNRRKASRRGKRYPQTGFRRVFGPGLPSNLVPIGRRRREMPPIRPWRPVSRCSGQQKDLGYKFRDIQSCPSKALLLLAAPRCRESRR